ncbi:unnamed protein product [Symbiodinium sp. CCMP2592]|nr:unnamed protein product [Symbiodinium sp. CCMP2592]
MPVAAQVTRDRSYTFGRRGANTPSLMPGEAVICPEVTAMEGLSVVALQTACPHPVDRIAGGRACGLNAVADTADLTARLAVHAACEEPVKRPEETEELHGQQQIVETPTALSPEEVIEPAPSEGLDVAIAGADASSADGANRFAQPSEDMHAKELPVTEQLDLVPSQLSIDSIPAAQLDWPWPQDGGGGSQTSLRSPVDPGTSQPLDEGFRAGLTLIHPVELRHLSERELLNTLLVHFACGPQPTPTQHARTRILQQQPAPLPSAPATAALATRPPTKSKTKAASSPPPKAPPQQRIDPEPAKSIAAQQCKLQTLPTSSEAKASNVQTVQTAIVQEVEQMQPLKPVQRAPLAHPSLVRRQRRPGAAVAPSFSALWQSMCTSLPKQHSENPDKADAGVGLTVRRVGMLPAHVGDRFARSRQTRSRNRTKAAGSCHAWTAAGQVLMWDTANLFVLALSTAPGKLHAGDVSRPCVDEFKPCPDKSASRTRKGAPDDTSSPQEHHPKLARQDAALHAGHGKQTKVSTAAAEAGNWLSQEKAVSRENSNRNERKRATPMPDEELPGKRARDKAKLPGLSQRIGLSPRSQIK